MRKKMYKAKKRWVVASVAIVAAIGQAGLAAANTTDNVSESSSPEVGLTQASESVTSSSVGETEPATSSEADSVIEESPVSTPVSSESASSGENKEETSPSSTEAAVSPETTVDKEVVSQDGQVTTTDTSAPSTVKTDEAVSEQKTSPSASQGNYAALNKIVYLDAGHGGFDPGAGYQGVSEKNLTLSIYNLVKKGLEQSGYQVESTRSDDRYVGLTERSNQANQTLADIFVSIHINASTSAATNGIETYYYKYDPYYPAKMNAQYHVDVERLKRSALLAQSIQASTVAKTGASDRGVLRQTFAVLRETTAPSVLLELGYLSNPSERANLSTKAYQEKLATGIVEGIKAYYRAYGVESKKTELDSPNTEVVEMPPVKNVAATSGSPVVAPSQPASNALAPSGTYEFTERTGVKNEAKLSSPDLAYYEAGQKVNYDKALTSEGYNWLSYVSHSGTRRYVAVSKQAASNVSTTPSTRPTSPVAAPSQPASNTLAPSGTYEFTERAGVKNEAKLSSPDLAYYEAGQKVNYDKTLTSEGYNWLSYVSHSGTRRYVAVSKQAASNVSTTPSTRPTSPVAAPSQPASSALAPSGTYEFTERAGVKNEAKLSSPDLAYYEAGQKVNYDKTLTSEDYNWLSYVSHSGTRRYVAVSKRAAGATASTSTSATPTRPTSPVAAPSQPASSALAPSGTYEFTERAGVKNEAKLSSPDLAYYEAGQKVNYDKTLTSEGYNWLSYVSHSGTRRYVAVSKQAAGATASTSTTPTRPTSPTAVPSQSASNALAPSGTYEFTERAGVKNEAKLSSPDLAYYEAGQKVNYDKTLTSEGYNWLSYVSHSGTRRYVAVSKQAAGATASTSTTPTRPTSPVVVPSQPASSALAPSGTYEFTERAGVKNEAKLSSPDLAYYEAGQKVNYDKTLTSEGYNWLSYVSHSGTRRYVAVSKQAAGATASTSTTPTRPTSPVVVPSQPASSALAPSGTYEFTERAGVKNEAKLSSPDLAYYEAGQKVNYDKTLTSEGYNWLSYVSHSGTRRYVAVSKQAVLPATTVSATTEKSAEKTTENEKAESSKSDNSVTTKTENGYTTTVAYQGTGVYQVTIDQVDSQKGPVKMAVWSEDNAQDDIRWYDLTTTASSAQAKFDVTNHQGTGRYQVHLYQENQGKMEFLTAISQEVKRTNFDIPYYSQRDLRWSTKRYGAYTMDATGCVPAALSMVFSGLSGKDIKPTEVADYLYNKTVSFNKLESGTIATGILEAANNWNMTATAVTSHQALVDALKEGHYVLAAVQGPPYVRVYGSLSHELVLSGYQNGMTYVRDPYTPALNGWRSLANIYNQQSRFPSDIVGIGKPFVKITDKL
ncbi:SH3 domain-containing protein [Streptococcus cuniculipharyngis]|nr:SH3 domain-containing protein [Streptococcus cuniculipharyngis]